MRMRILNISNRSIERDSLRTDLQNTQLDLHVVHASTVNTAEHHLQNDHFDVALLSAHLSDSNQRDAIRRLRAVDEDLPIIVLMETDDNELAVAALSAGAQDILLTSQLASTHLERVIHCSIERVKQDQRIRAENEQLQQTINASSQFIDDVCHDIRTPLTVHRRIRVSDARRASWRSHL